MMITLNGESLTLETLINVVENFEPVKLDSETKKKLQKSRDIVEKSLESDKKIYAINTGFGILSNVQIPKDQLLQLQENIIRSHCTSVGNFHCEKESRAILLLRTNVLAKGYSGVSVALVEFLAQMLNQQIHPVIPEKGSVGASGDLSPLAHLAAVVIGEGEAFFKGQRCAGKVALEMAKMQPYRVSLKEGLSLINGTQQMTAMGALILRDAEQLIDLADLVCASSLEGVLGSRNAFKAWLQATRPYKGQALSAQRLWRFTENSEIANSHMNCDRVQDAYSLRCSPQVHGSIRDLLSFVHQTISIELNAATDNPLVNYETGEIQSNGNFHGQPVAFALDIMAMALSEMASISERRLVKLLDPHFSGLPSFLVKNEGLNSGFMATQYTAAALVSENKTLTHPGSTDSIPTCNDKEDHVSMGPWCARKAKSILENTQTVLAIELLAACQALEFRKPLTPGHGVKVIYDLIRKHVPSLEQDRYLFKDINTVTELIKSGKLYAELKQKNCFKD